MAALVLSPTTIGDIDMEQHEAFGYKWTRDNGEYYYGIHLGTDDDGYTGSGSVFKKKFNGSDRYEWTRTIEIRGTYDDCSNWEADTVNVLMLEDKLCLNQKTGGLTNIPSQATKDKISKTLTENPVSYWTGKPRSEETKRKLRNANLGKRHTEEAKRNMKGISAGEANGNTPLTESEVHIIKYYLLPEKVSLKKISCMFEILSLIHI